MVELRNIDRRGDPKTFEVESVVLVHHNVTLGDHVAPGHLRMALAQSGRERPRCLAKDREVVGDGLLGAANGLERLFCRPLCPQSPSALATRSVFEVHGANVKAPRGRPTH